MSISKQLQLSSEQKRSFITNGYLKLPQAISPNLLEELRVAVDNLARIGEQLQDNTVLESTSKQKFVVAIDKIAAKKEPVFKQLLGSPLLLSIAESLSGADFFPVQDFIVIKTLGDQNEVKWHQDVISNCHEKTFMIGFYLDPTNDKNGALRVIPGSHKSNLPICELEKMEYQSLDMQAGDILIHNLKIAHSSGELATFSQRRVVYFEFMAANDIVKEQVYPESFVQLRTSLIPNAMSCFEKAYPDAIPFLWKHPEKEKFSVSKDPVLAIEEVYQVKKQVKVANYCFDFIDGYVHN
jgi:ectoine hydroxylase-related dioxygenase (phytanoyl-CoA dioxygenase family)